MGTRSSAIEKKSQVIDFNVGLGLRMQTHHHEETLTKTNVNMLDFESHKRMSQPHSQSHPPHHHHHQQQINILSSSSSSSTNSGEGLGGIMATSGNLRAGFTASQWQELKRQTMIFKYMMASAPVPPELLLPITKNPPIPPLQRSSRNSDPEPWRCRRTDGKKWRCSRDVAPHQKYCERHSHKNRPRSRKPVELQAQHHVNSNTNPQLQSIDNVNNYNRPYQTLRFDVQNQTDEPGPLFPSQLPSAIPLDRDQPRYLEWFMNGENIAVGNPNNGEWNQYMHNTKVGFKGDIDSSHNTTTATITTCSRDAYHLRQPHVPLYAYESTTTVQELHAPKLTSFLDPNGQGHETRHFIDTWSDAAPGDDGIDVNGNVNVGSSLSLTMHGGSDGNQVTGAGAINLKPHWMNGNVDWMSSPPGGPLAEVLCLGTGGLVRPGVYETSPHGCSSITTTSSRSSSKEDGQELNFIN